MANIVESIAQALKLDSLDTNESLAFVEEKTKIKPSVIALSLIVFLTLIIIVAEASALVIGISCFLIPAYFSFLALETLDQDDDKKYLTYWILFSISEVLSPLLSWAFSPTFYTIGRVLIAIGLLHPQLNLSVKLYDAYLAPLLTKHENEIDAKIDELK